MPGATFSAAGALARLPQAMAGLGALVMVTELGGSYSVAGAVAGAVSLSQALLAPRVSRLTDRLGQTRVLGPQAALNVAAMVALVVAAYLHAPPAALVGLGAAVGVTLPQIGAAARARWTGLLAGDPRLDTALATESLIEEAVFVVGPVLVVAAATGVAPGAGLLVAAALVAVGCALFLAHRSTEPPPRPAGGDQRRVRATASRGVRVLIVMFLAIGVLFGLTEVGVVALTRDLGHPGISGVLLAAWAGASLVSGTIYGSRTWPGDPARRLMLSAAAMTVGGVLIAVATQSVVAAAVALVIAGTANAPTLITGNTLVAVVAPAEAITEAYTWLSVTVFAGIAVGATVGGALIDHGGAPNALWAAAGAGVLATTAAAAGRRAQALADSRRSSRG
ncbi:MFS transporter [Micromonospora sp. NPDC051300]|uniref:MFS transporter n=1 Tax=Micromonospora sp. NPDC051300 TaxID=3364286 RepID=UPI0037960EBA